MDSETRAYIKDCVAAQISSRSEKLKEEIKKDIEYKGSEFEARQQLLISEVVKQEIAEIESQRHRRLQLTASIGGFSVVTLALLAWGNISSVVSNTADAAIKPRVDEIAALKKEYEVIEREVKSLSGRVNDRLSEVEEAISESRAAMDAVETAKGGMAIMQDLIEIKLKLDDLEDASAAVPNLPPSADKPRVSASDCVRPDGTLDLSCTPGGN